MTSRWACSKGFSPSCCPHHLLAATCSESLSATRKMPGKLKKSKCPVTRITIIYLPHFPLSLKKILRVLKLPKWMSEWINNRWKSMLQFVRCWSKKLSWLSQSVLPRATQCWPHIPATQKKRYPPSENSFCHCSPFRFGFVVPRWENHPPAPQLIPCQAHHNLQGSSKIKWDLLSFFFFFLHDWKSSAFL